MRPRMLSVLATGALVVGLAASPGYATSASQAPSLVARGRAAVAPAAPSGLQLLYDQNDNDAGVGIVSQDFTDSGFDIYDASGADDFTVPTGHSWRVQAVVVTGVYFQCTVCGPADSQTVTIYRNTGGLPGAVVRAFAGLHGQDTAGSFRIKLPGTGVPLRAGRYWVSVQATMAYAAGGEWAWETRSVVQGGSPAAWQNPGDGFSTGCTTYTNMASCIVAGQGPDFMFALYGQTT